MAPLPHLVLSLERDRRQLIHARARQLYFIAVPTLNRSRTRVALTKKYSMRAQAQRYNRPQLHFGQLRHLVVIETSMCVEVKH